MMLYSGRDFVILLGIASLAQAQSDANAAACDLLSSATLYCESATPGFSTMTDLVDQAGCFCYDLDGTWDPSLYDGVYGSCLQFIKTADPTFYSSLSSAEGGTPTSTPCAAAGNVLNGPIAGQTPTPSPTPTPSTTPTPTTGPADPNSTACQNLNDIYVSCSSATPNFDNLPFTEEASCYCYNGNSFAPQAYDSAFAGCAQYYSTASPADYASLSSLGAFDTTTPCAAGGDFINGGGAATPPITSPPTPRPTSTTPSSPTTTDIGEEACSIIIDIAPSICESETPGFTTLDFTIQASCYCYSSTSWDPQLYDSAYGACANYLSTADPSDYSELSSSGAFDITTPCAYVGDIVATPLGTTSRESTSKEIIPPTSISRTPATVTATVTTPTGGTSTAPATTSASGNAAREEKANMGLLIGLLVALGLL